MRVFVTEQVPNVYSIQGLVPVAFRMSVNTYSNSWFSVVVVNISYVKLLLNVLYYKHNFYWIPNKLAGLKKLYFRVRFFDIFIMAYNFFFIKNTTKLLKK